MGLSDPLSLEDYRAHGGFSRAGACASAMTGEELIQEVTDSGLRGRGGAAFPTGLKWTTVREAAG